MSRASQRLERGLDPLAQRRQRHALAMDVEDELSTLVRDVEASAVRVKLEHELRCEIYSAARERAADAETFYREVVAGPWLESQYGAAFGELVAAVEAEPRLRKLLVQGLSLDAARRVLAKVDA